MIKKINNWLEDKNRDYASGLEYFNRLADENLKSKVGKYLNEFDKADKDAASVRFPMLINKVTMIYSKIKINPEAFKNLLVEEESIKDTVNKIVALHKTVEELTDKVNNLEESSDDNAYDITSLNDNIEINKEEIENLKKKLADNKITVINSDDLPVALKKKYTRNKEIVPIIALLHTDLTKDGISDEDRKKTATEICNLDDERRANWDSIDDYLENGSMALPEDKSLNFSDDPIVKGVQIGKRIERLIENISRSSASLEKFKKGGKENLAVKAQNRIDAYTEELEELQKQVNEKS